MSRVKSACVRACTMKFTDKQACFVLPWVLHAASLLLVPNFVTLQTTATSEHVEEPLDVPATVPADSKTVAESSQPVAGTTEEVTGTTEEVAGTTEEVAGTTEEVAGTTEEVAGTTEEVTGTTEEVAGTTEEVAGTTEEVAGTTEEVAGTTEEVAGTTEEVAGTTEEVAGTTEEVAGTTEEVAGTTEEVAGTREEVAGTTEEVAGTSDSLPESRPTDVTATSSSPPVTPLLTTSAKNVSRHANPVTLPHSETVPCNKSCCNCQGTQAKCSGRGRCVRQLPQLSAHVKEFHMVGATLPDLTRRTLAGLNNVHIRVMCLKNNSISRLEPDTFVDFRNLTSLDLSENDIPLHHLSTGLKSISSPHLKKLNLEEMGLTELPLDFFQMFASETLDILRLKNNRLRSFNSRVFAPFHRVEYLDLSNNLISRVNISSRVHVEILALQDNALRDFPNLCLHHLSNSETANAFLKLRTLRIGGNQFETIAPRPLRGVCLPDLLKLDISFSTNLHTLQNNFIADLPAIEHLVANKLVRLNSYKPFAFNSSSLKRLNLQLNRLLHSDTVDVHHLFRHCPSLEHLNLAGTKVHLTETLLRQLLVPLTSLTTLNLEHVGAGFLPRDLLWRLPRLQKLYASGNRLNSTSLGGALRNVRSLVYLNVRGNQLQVVDASTVPWSVRQNLTYLDMSANPFACTCQLRWFTSWLEDIAANRNVTVHGYTNPGYQGHFRCHTPAERKWLPLRDFHLTDEDCTERSLALALGAAGGCVLAFVGVVIALAYRYRWYLRFFLYRCRRSRPRGDDEERAEMVHEFDIYVAHSPRELEWVSDQLVPLLEGQHGLRAFLLERDSAPGSVKADNIPVFLDRSARVLLLVSEAYLQEDWQMYEFQHIVYAVVDQQKDVIVVLRGNFHAGRMPRELTRMLTRGTFLQWGEGQKAQRVFREGLRVALETHDAACHNVC